MSADVTDKRTMLKWTADGKLREVKVNPLSDELLSSEDQSPTKPGSGRGRSGSGPRSSSSSNNSNATTEIAFSNFDYPVTDENPDPGAVLFKVRGKPGVLKKNLLIIPLLTLMLMFTGVDVL